MQTSILPFSMHALAGRTVTALQVRTYDMPNWGGGGGGGGKGHFLQHVARWCPASEYCGIDQMPEIISSWLSQALRILSIKGVSSFEGSFE